MEPETHIGDLAELYAAGALDDREQVMVESHIAHCKECTQRVGDAEETILALERRFKVSDTGYAPPRLALKQGRALGWPLVGIAAALVVGFLLPHPVSRQNPAELAMIQSHFSHAQFSGSGPAAKVLYARDRSWYYVIVEGSHRLDVYGVREGRGELLGSTQPVALTSNLFVRASQRFEAMELRENGRLLERAAIR